MLSGGGWAVYCTLAPKPGRRRLRDPLSDHFPHYNPCRGINGGRQHPCSVGSFFTARGPDVKHPLSDLLGGLIELSVDVDLNSSHCRTAASEFLTRVANLVTSGSSQSTAPYWTRSNPASTSATAAGVK